MINDRTGVLDLEATGGVGGRNVEQHGTPAPLLPLEWQILQEAEVTTPPRGELTDQGAVRLPSLSYHPEGHKQCLRFLRTSGQGTSVRTDGMMPGHLQMCWLTRLLACNRTWRTGGVHNDKSAAVWWDDQLGTIVLSNGWDNETAALQLFSHLEGDALNVALLVPMSRRLSRTGLVDALSAHYGSPGRLVDYRRQFEKTTRSAGVDPSNFATALETLAVKA